MGMVLDEPKNDDEKFLVNGISILAGANERDYAENSQIDYIDDYRGKGLTIQPLYGSEC
ncbi:hypothetical protein H8D59_02750 [bacterium]|nr:hypothetical protein [bacterium]MBL7052261.1 hypothetical protein [Candidatus Neomarinimicrobiota bacterium]